MHLVVQSRYGVKKVLICVSTNMPKNIRVGWSEILLFLSAFYMLISWQNCVLVFNNITIKPTNNEE